MTSPPGILGGIAGVILALAALVGAMQQRSRRRRNAGAADADTPGPPVLDVDPAIALLLDDLRAQIGDLRRKVEACETRDRRNATRFATMQERDRLRKREVSELRAEVSRLRTILADRGSR